MDNQDDAAKIGKVGLLLIILAVASFVCAAVLIFK